MILNAIINTVVVICIGEFFENAIFFFQAEDGIRGHCVTGVQTCALPLPRLPEPAAPYARSRRERRGSAAGPCGCELRRRIAATSQPIGPPKYRPRAAVNGTKAPAGGRLKPSVRPINVAGGAFAAYSAARADTAQLVSLPAPAAPAWRRTPPRGARAGDVCSTRNSIRPLRLSASTSRTKRGSPS